MVEDAADDVWLSDEADDAHGAGAPGADEGVDFVDAPQQVRPSLAHGRGRCSLRLGVVLGVAGLVSPTLAPGGIRVASIVADAAGNQIVPGTQCFTTSATISGLPTNGSLLYVRLWSLMSGTWRSNDYTYKAAGVP